MSDRLRKRKLTELRGGYNEPNLLWQHIDDGLLMMECGAQAVSYSSRKVIVLDEVALRR